MLVLDAETLAKHYVKGSLSRKQFVSLSASLAQVEQYVQSKRMFAQLVGIDTEDLYAMWDSEFDVYHFVDLIIKGNPEPLPDDLRLATEYLSNTAIWERVHIKQYTKQWAQLDDQEKDVIRKTNWFQEFSLLASIKKVEHEKRIINGDIGSIQNLNELGALANSLS
ncbi:MAG: hypothetical protein P8Y28_14835 [Gammaproteobacteria bacterium]